MDNLSVPHELTALEREAILTHLRALGDADAGAGEEAIIRSFEFNLPGKPPLFIKHSGDPDILIEASTQHFFYVRSCAQSDDSELKSAPRIPKVFDAFFSEEGDYIMVMEKIDAPTLGESGIKDEKAVGYAADAMGWLIEQGPWVPDTCFGRISEEKAPVWHQFFKDHRAPSVFASPEELAEYVSKASQRCRSKGQPQFSTAVDELLTSITESQSPSRCIYHSDISERNFLLLPLDSDSKTPNRVCIIDFQHIGIFPPAFQNYAFFNIDKAFAAHVGKRLGYRPSVGAGNVMVRISSVIQQSGGMAGMR